MGAIGGLLGFGGGAAGTDFQGPQGTNIVNPTDKGQIDKSYAGVQNSLESQKALLSALQAQNGLGNQSSVFNQMQGTANQYQNLANGTGPNPAQQALANATGQNVANQAALMAGQRGAGTNAGLIARQAAQQGAATQQQAVGQSALQQAQQQIAGLQGLSAQQQAMGNLASTQASNQIGQTNANTSAQQAEQANLMNAQAAANNANVSMQSNINNANAGLANTQMQGQQGMIGGLMQGIGGLIGLAHGGRVQRYDDGGQVEVPAIAAASPTFGSDNAGVAALSKGMSSLIPKNPLSSGGGGDSSGGGSGGGPMGMLSGLMGGGGGGGASGLMSLAALLADGGDVTSAPVAPTAPSGSSASSIFGQFLHKKKTKASAAPAQAAPSFGGGSDAMRQGAAALTQGLGSRISDMAQSQPDVPGYSMPELGSQYSGSQNAPTLGVEGLDKAPASGPSLGVDLNFSSGGMAHDYRGGGKVVAKTPKQKAVVKGNSYKNDKIPALVSEGEVVIPRSVMQSKDPVRSAADFVAKTIAKRKAKR